MAFEPKRNMEAELEAEVYQGSASPHSVIVKHINQVLAAEHKHMVEYQREQEQIQVERRVRHERERTQLAAQAHSINPIITNTNESISLDATKDDDMNLKQFAVTAMTAGTLVTATLSTSACSAEELVQTSFNRAGEEKRVGDDFDITKNLYAKQAYKLKVKIKDAPGVFDSILAAAWFDIDNVKDCGYFLGGSFQDTVPGLERYIPVSLTKISDTEYTGVFYIDWGKSGDFFGKGVCYWKLANISVTARATGADGETLFINGLDLNAVQNGVVDTAFYLIEDYPTVVSLPNYHNYGTTKDQLHTLKPELLSKLFSITITTEKTP